MWQIQFRPKDFDDDKGWIVRPEEFADASEAADAIREHGRTSCIYRVVEVGLIAYIPLTN